MNYVHPALVLLSALLVKSRYVFLFAMLASHDPITRASTASSLPVLSNDQVPVNLNPVLISAQSSRAPLVTEIDAKAPTQPIPAQDGADYLKSVPGFSVIRKGGTDGDPVLRGQAGSRLNILLDGQNIFGGCGNRMDPPTAYVFPSAYDRVVVVKGPQTVAYGPGATAGVVRFERDIKRFTEPDAKSNGSLTLGSFGRHDEAVEARAGIPDLYVQGSATKTTSGDYEDGAGKKVHSSYRRWSTNTAVGWTPSDQTSLELSAARSNGRAAYADRTMDGSKFLRENVGVSFKRYAVSELFQKIEASGYYNYADHIMDNYTLRSASTMPMLMNPDRKTIGCRTEVDLSVSDDFSAKLGGDFQKNFHSGRMSLAAPFVRDAAFDDQGFFGEFTQKVAASSRFIAGVRADLWDAVDNRKTVTVGSGMMGTVTANPTANVSRNTTLWSGFARFEHDLSVIPLTLYAGLGTTSRFPDYWELINKESTTTLSSFETKSERNVQVDAGAHYKTESLSASFSIFGNRIYDYVLIQTDYAKPAMMGNRVATVVRNIEASSYGAEAAFAYHFLPNWSVDASLAFVHGVNDTENRPLAQQPPLELRLGLAYTTSLWSAGVLTRSVAKQDRFARNQGNIIGQDIGPSEGFNLVSFNASWTPVRYAKLSVGVDNAFDQTYAEFISRAGSAVTGYAQTTRVNEPGRTAWAKLTLKY